MFLTAIHLVAQAAPVAAAVPDAKAIATVQDALDRVDRGEAVKGRPLNLQETFSDDDYPADALRAGKDGTVVARVSIGRDGHVERCDIQHSANFANLDRVSCAKLLAKARYTIVRDQSGRAVSYQIDTRIRWLIPGGRAFSRSQAAAATGG